MVLKDQPSLRIKSMDGLDQVEEWRRLKEFYSRMNDGEREGSPMARPH
jgi:hypothetical protein